MICNALSEDLKVYSTFRQVLDRQGGQCGALGVESGHGMVARMRIQPIVIICLSLPRRGRTCWTHV